jgi:hypothetical protein
LAFFAAAATAVASPMPLEASVITTACWLSGFGL